MKTNGKKLSNTGILEMRSLGDSRGTILARSDEKYHLLDPYLNPLFEYSGMLMGLGNDMFLSIEPGNMGIYDTGANKLYKGEEYAPHMYKFSTPKGKWYFDWNHFAVLQDAPGGSFMVPALVDLNSIGFYDTHSSMGFWDFGEFRRIFGAALENKDFAWRIHWGKGATSAMKGKWPETMETRPSLLTIHFKDKDLWYARFGRFDGGSEPGLNPDPLGLGPIDKPYAVLDSKYKPVFEEFQDVEFPGYRPFFDDKPQVTNWIEAEKTPDRFYGKKDGRWDTYNLKGKKIATGRQPPEGHEGYSDPYLEDSSDFAKAIDKRKFYFTEFNYKEIFENEFPYDGRPVENRDDYPNLHVVFNHDGRSVITDIYGRKLSSTPFFH